MGEQKALALNGKEKPPIPRVTNDDYATLTEWVRKHKDELRVVTREEAVVRAKQALTVTITENSMKRAAKRYGFFFRPTPRRRRGSGAKNEAYLAAAMLFLFEAIDDLVDKGKAELAARHRAVLLQIAAGQVVATDGS